jgi:hypothetical protein
MLNKFKLKYEYSDNIVKGLSLKIIGVCDETNYCESICFKINNEYVVLDRGVANDLGHRLISLTDKK